MIFFRLPVRPDEKPTWWQWGDSRKIVILMPGDALLCESLELPDGVTRTKEIKEWFHASVHQSQWRPDQDKLVMLKREGDRCVYWAVDAALWQHWQVLVQQSAPYSRWMPDWMLLPKPDQSRSFALKTDDGILFRHTISSGGALPLELAHLLTPLCPRWLTLSGINEGYFFSSGFWQKQIRKHSRRWESSPLRRLLNMFIPVFITVSSAFLVWQGANIAWIWSTRAPVPYSQAHKAPSASHPMLLDAVDWLNKAQMLGPVQLQFLQLNGLKVRMELVSPVSCDELRMRMKALPYMPQFRQQNDVCEIVLQGDKKDV